MEVVSAGSTPVHHPSFLTSDNCVFVTGNSYKFEVAKKALDQAGIEVIQQKLDAPEIQSTDASEIASYSAKWAANKLGKPAVVTDAGYYIEALHGFPGPFIKFINKWLTAQDLIKLMKGKANRKAEIKICMAYCEPGQEPVNFVTKVAGTIALKPGTPTDGGSAMDRVFITEGFELASNRFRVQLDRITSSRIS